MPLKPASTFSVRAGLLLAGEGQEPGRLLHWLKDLSQVSLEANQKSLFTNFQTKRQPALGHPA